MPTSTVQKWSAKGGWKARLAASGGSAVAAAGRTLSAPATAEDIDARLAELIELPFAEKQQAYKELMANESLRIALAVRSIPSGALVQNADKVKKLDEVGRRGLAIEENQPQVVVNVGLLAQAASVTRLVTRADVVEAPALSSDTTATLSQVADEKKLIEAENC